MLKPFDTITRQLHTLDPAAWTRLVGVRAKTVTSCDTNMSTVRAEVDCLSLIDSSWALHFENQASYSSDMGDRMLEYNVLASNAVKVPVRSVVVLLRPEADGPAMSGSVRRSVPGNDAYLDFRFEVLRVWTMPAQRFFDAGLGVLPLSFIADVPRPQVPELVKRTKARLKREAKPKLAAEIWAAIALAMGLRYEKREIEGFLEGVRHMEESVTFQAIKAQGKAEGKAEGKLEGRADEARDLLLKLGTEHIGKPPATVRSRLNKIKSKAQLEKLALRAPRVATWQELLK